MPLKNTLGWIFYMKKRPLRWCVEFIRKLCWDIQVHRMRGGTYGAAVTLQGDTSSYWHGSGDAQGTSALGRELQATKGVVSGRNSLPWGKSTAIGYSRPMSAPWGNRLQSNCNRFLPKCTKEVAEGPLTVPSSATCSLNVGCWRVINSVFLALFSTFVYWVCPWGDTCAAAPFTDWAVSLTHFLSFKVKLATSRCSDTFFSCNKSSSVLTTSSQIMTWRLFFINVQP